MARNPDPSPAQTARENRLRLAKEEGARAMEEAQKQALAVRKNMDRLRELRLAKEAEAARELIANGPPPKAKSKKPSKAKEKAI
jgi:hypothetical protein